MVNPNKTWLPDNYEVPKSGGGGYMKFEDGTNKFRVLSNPKMGWEYWTADNKPVRLREKPKEKPADMREDSKIKHFWALVVWNYKEKAVQILQITQATIQRDIGDLVVNPVWGSPTQYDLIVIRRGEGLETKYTTQSEPHKLTPPEILNSYESMNINLDALFEGKDPFEGGSPAAEPASEDEEMMAEANPFGKDIL